MSLVPSGLRVSLIVPPFVFFNFTVCYFPFFQCAQLYDRQKPTVGFSRFGGAAADIWYWCKGRFVASSSYPLTLRGFRSDFFPREFAPHW